MLIFDHLINKRLLLDLPLKSPVKVDIHDNKMNPISYSAFEVLVLPTTKD